MADRKLTLIYTDKIRYQVTLGQDDDGFTMTLGKRLPPETVTITVTDDNLIKDDKANEWLTNSKGSY